MSPGQKFFLTAWLFVVTKLVVNQCYNIEAYYFADCCGDGFSCRIYRCEFHL